MKHRILATFNINKKKNQSERLYALKDSKSEIQYLKQPIKITLRNYEFITTNEMAFDIFTHI
jgi:hypothetical protein